MNQFITNIYKIAYLLNPVHMKTITLFSLFCVIELSVPLIKITLVKLQTHNQCIDKQIF